DTLLWLAVAVTPIIFLASQLALPPQSSRVVAAANPATQVLRCALTNNSYIFLALAFFVCGFQIVFIATHLPAYLTSVGHSPQVAAWALSLIGIFNIAGSLICGWLGSRYSKRIILVWLYLVRSLVIALFILVPQSTVTVLLFGSTIGLLWLGTVPLTSSLVINFFGQRHMTMLCGVVFLMHQMGSFCGSWAGGLIYDASGSYDIMWWLCVALGVLAAALHLPIRERADQVFASRYA
ncbi:MAG: MFS transporter, partial [Candidatus Porifericomitaceae bacterium WSBS_2022_MAG_OTU9]